MPQNSNASLLFREVDEIEEDTERNEATQGGQVKLASWSRSRRAASLSGSSAPFAAARTSSSRSNA